MLHTRIVQNYGSTSQPYVLSGFCWEIVKTSFSFAGIMFYMPNLAEQLRPLANIDSGQQVREHNEPRVSQIHMADPVASAEQHHSKPIPVTIVDFAGELKRFERGRRIEAESRDGLSSYKVNGVKRLHIVPAEE